MKVTTMPVTDKFVKAEAPTEWEEDVPVADESRGESAYNPIQSTDFGGEAEGERPAEATDGDISELDVEEEPEDEVAEEA